MDWLKPSFFALLLVVLIGQSQCRVRDDSKFGVVKRYEECVLSRLSRSRFFKEHDRNRLSKAVEKSNLQLNDKKVSDVLLSFTTTATNLVAGSNSALLVDSYVTVTETCSLSLPPPLAEDVMREVQKILSGETDVRGATTETVLSRKRTVPTPPPDVKIRRKRSPQGVSFGTFWQPSESLQTVLSNILLNSNPFQNAFSGRTSRRDAIFYARSMVESGLSNYHFSVVQDVVSSVVNAISNFPFQPEANDYAIAIANGIASVLDARELSVFADGAGIGNAMVSRLQIMLNNRNPTRTFQSGFGGASSSASSFSWSNSGSNQRQAPNFQMNSGFVPNIPMNPSFIIGPQLNPSFGMNQPMNPGFMMNPASNPNPVPDPPMNPTFFDVPQADPAEEFQSDMAFYLYQSDKIQGAFCNGPFSGAYDMVNEGLSEYGMPVSAIAASSASDSLSSTDPSEVCAMFGSIIAESVTSALRDSNLLQSANAQQIVDRMAESISQAPPPSGQQEEPPVFFESPPSDPIPPQYPDYGMPPFVPMDETQSAPESLEPPPQSSDSAEMPPQETKPQVEYPLLDPSFVPSDYAVDTAILTGTDIPTRLEPSPDVSGTGVQQPAETPEVPGTEVQQPAETPDESQSKLDVQDRAPQKDEMTTTQLMTSENFMSSTLPDVMTTTTTPYPEAATTPSVKAMDTILEEILTDLRTLNSTSDGKPDSGSNKEDAVTSPSPTAPEMEKADSSVARVDTLQSSSVTPIAPEAPVAVELQPSFMSTSPPRDLTTPDDDDSDLRDPALVFAHHVADIASAAISMIRSRRVTFPELCDKLYPLAAVVDIPPLDTCDEVALVDFLLNVLKAVTLILKGVS